MACTATGCYLPDPARLWSRLENRCGDQSDQQATLSAQQQKGNVLQHRGNMAALTRNQRYAQAMRGVGCRRRRGWATQSSSAAGATNSNAQGLRRVGAHRIAVSRTTGAILGPTALPLTCPGDSGSSSSSSVEVILSGGTLVCGTYENPCTGAATARVARPSACHPASASNVPGDAMLCWTTRTSTWIPRTRRAMPGSGGVREPPPGPIRSAIQPCLNLNY